MKTQMLPPGKRPAAAGLILALLLTAGCSRVHPVPVDPTPSPSAASTQTPAPSPSLEELDEHGLYLDPDVYITPSPAKTLPQASPRYSHDLASAYSQEAFETVVWKISSKLYTSDMTAVQRCQAAYFYIRDHISCVGVSDTTDWQKAAYQGFTSGRGDSFTYYACSRALLTDLGYQVQQVKREGGGLSDPHFWSLVNYGAGWSHFDPYPHLKSDPEFFCFLASDQDLLNFDAGAGRDYYAFDADAYPERSGGRADPSAVVPLPRRDGQVPDPSPSPTSTTVPSEPPQPSETPVPSAPPAPSAATPRPTVRPTARPVSSPPPAAVPTPSGAPPETLPSPEPPPEPAAPDLSEEPILPPDSFQ